MIDAVQLREPRFRTKAINLVLIGGKAGVGKTTASEMLCTSLSAYPNLSVDHTAFAKPIKELAFREFQWDGKKDERGRRLLQVLGTDAGRAYDQNIWVRKFDAYAMDDDTIRHFIFVDDWRFPNEKEYFDHNFFYDVTTIRIERDFVATEGDASVHPSEISLPIAEKENLVYNKDEYYNFSIHNNGSLEELSEKLDTVYQYLQTKIIAY